MGTSRTFQQRPVAAPSEHPVFSVLSRRLEVTPPGPQGASTLEAPPLKLPPTLPPVRPEMASFEGQARHMSDDLKNGLESLSGLSLDDVRVHYNSSKPVQLQSLAYTQGKNIYVAPGQEKHVPHEGWHAVQQQQGRVRPTFHSAGLAINSDPGLEREADVMGAKATRQARAPAPGAWTAANARASAASPRLTTPVVQRYLIVGNTDYTRLTKPAPDGGGADMAATVDAVLASMEGALNRADPHENTVYDFLHANVGGLVKRQIQKWIEDDQGVPGKHPVFGRKQQARVYDNYKDLATAIYGWVTSKQGRRDEKAWAQQAYNNTILEGHLDNVMTKVWAYINAQVGSAAQLQQMEGLGGAAWHGADYRRWFSLPGALAPALPATFSEVLQNPAGNTFRDKIATLHDVMKYFMRNSGTSGAGLINESDFVNFQATTEAGRAVYQRPESSIIRRDPIAVNRLAPVDIVGERAAGRIRAADEEQHPTFIYARKNGIPMWARHSYTAARMMQLARQAGANADELSAVAWGVVSFWRQDYDHRSLPYHTLHEVMDFAPHFGFDYDPANRGADLARHTDPIPALMIRLNAVADSAIWASRVINRVRGPRAEAPSVVLTIRGELAAARTDEAKLERIRNAVQGHTGWAFSRHRNTRRFYQILDQIPADIADYNDPGTSKAAKARMVTALRQVLQDLTDFAP